MSKRRKPFYPVSGGKPDRREHQETHSTGLDQEIDLMRFFIRRVALQQGKAVTLLESASIVRTVSIALFSLTQLVRTNHALREAGEPVMDQLEHTLEDISREMARREKQQITLP